MVAIFLLITLSVFMPPFWLVTAGYIAYLIATRKKRRDKIIMDEIMQSIAQQRERVRLDYLYFPSARNFAIEQGIILFEDDDSLVVKLKIDEQDYRITLQRQNNNETQLSVFFAEKADTNQQSAANAKKLQLKDSA